MTRAKILVQHLWDKKRDCDDPLLPEDLLQSWCVWESKLQLLPDISVPRCYIQSLANSSCCTDNIHVFLDASERAYGAVAYLRTEEVLQKELTLTISSVTYSTGLTRPPSCSG